MDSSTRKRIVILGGGFRGPLRRALAWIARWRAIRTSRCCSSTRRTSCVFTPMLHEVASGSLDPSSIVVPIRQALRRVEFFQAEATAVDFDARTVTAAYGLERRTRTIRFDHLLIAAGSQTRFPPGLRRHAHGMKTIHDALVLRNWLIGLLERAEIEEDAERRRALLTIVVAGGGFSGVETIGAINDFLRDVARHYRPSLGRIAVAWCSSSRSGDCFRNSSRRSANTRSRNCGPPASTCGCAPRWRASMVGRCRSTPRTIAQAPSQLAARTLIWTAGVAPSPLIESLPLQKERGRIVVDATHGGARPRGRVGVRRLRRRSRPGRQALSDHRTACGSPRAPASARNIAAAVRGHHRKIRPFRYKMLGQFAAIGRQRAVATLFGLRFSGFIAWLMWRGAYLLMLPRLDRKIRVLLQWILDICFARDTVQLLTVQSVRSGRVEELMDSARAAESADASDSEERSLVRSNSP